MSGPRIRLFSASAFSHFLVMPLPHTNWLFAFAFTAALFSGCETAAPERITLQPVENPSRLRSSNTNALTQMPAALVQTAPQYPFVLRKAGIQGEALVEFLIGPDGSVVEAAVLRATDVRFGDAAVDCIKRWRFEPGRVDGKPVTCRMQVPIQFTLQNG